MGRQSARMIYQGKDHKDIYFQGHYHDAMYLGYELLWRKIRQEGYYVLISVTGESYAKETLNVHVFDEKTQKIKKVLEVKRADMNPYGDAYDISFMLTMDSERIYLSTIGDTLIAASEDGTHYKNTNLDSVENTDIFLNTLNYYEYTAEENGVSQNVNYVWGISTGYWFTIRLRKHVITKSGDSYSVESKTLDTGFSTRNVDFGDYKESYQFYTSKYRKSKIAIYEKLIINNYGTYKEQKTVSFKYYDTETESSGDIDELNYGINIRYRIPDGFYCVNGVYLFFFVEDDYGENISKLYVYYSFDGINYDKSLITKKILTTLDSEITIPSFVLYRSGMYYIYCTREDRDFLPEYKAPNTLFLTTDFKHFQKKHIPREIEIDGITFDPVNVLQPMEDAGYCRYFCDGEPSTPEDGILATTTSLGIFYIDNMFFRESKGNKKISLS